MSKVSVFISGASVSDVERFLSTGKLSGVRPKVEDETIWVTCQFSSRWLEAVYEAMADEAERGWKEPDSRNVFQFASAAFPSSATRLSPVRQLRGAIEARLERKKANLPPAGSLPRHVFGTAIASESERRG